SQLDDVLARARAAGVSRMITIGTDLVDDGAAVATCRGRDELRCAVGIHPNHAHAFDLADLPKLRALQADASVVALGEMGLDYHYDFTPRDHQRAVFMAQLRMAAELDRSVVIHCREAVDDTLAVLGEFPGVHAVFHCFTGTPAEARRVLDAGYLLGFTGPVTYKKNDELRQAVRLTPADRLLVETDAPYLSPEPVRKQKTNEPALIMHTARVVAKVKGMTLDELDAATTSNAERFFRIERGASDPPASSV
ncbi:MAG: TatD family hydrolase, partial [Tepidisphaeraceae bacterium]